MNTDYQKALREAVEKAVHGKREIAGVTFVCASIEDILAAVASVKHPAEEALREMLTIAEESHDKLARVSSPDTRWEGRFMTVHRQAIERARAVLARS